MLWWLWFRIDTSDGIRRVYEILTLNVAVWHVMCDEALQLEETSFGQFHAGDTYVVRWNYVISQKGKLL